MRNEGSLAIRLVPGVRRSAVVCVIFLAWFVISPQLLAGIEVAHAPLTCVAVGAHPVIRAELETGAQTRSLRVHFRLSSSPDDYYVEMRHRDGSSYFGVLPSPSNEGETLSYSVVVRGDTIPASRAFRYQTRVVADCPGSMNDAERRAAKNIVVGLTRGDKDGFLPGFSCDGVIAKISPEGDLSSLFGCSNGTLAKFGPGSRAAGPSAKGETSAKSTSVALDASQSVTGSVSRAPLSSNGLVIGGTNTIGVTAGVLNDVPISSCRPR